MIPAWVVSADWSLHPEKRAVWVADVASRTVRRLESAAWDLEALLLAAEALPGPVVVGVDLALGLPAGFPVGGSFVDWLGSDAGGVALEAPTVASADGWSPATPFFRVPPGKGSLTAFRSRAGFSLKRKIDAELGAKEMFVVSGIPGTVGSGTRCFWRELRPRLTGRPFGIWPFDGALEPLLASRRVVVAEMYPGLAYTPALAGALPATRLRVAKTHSDARLAAVDALMAAGWVARHAVRLEGLEAARGNEDDFDAAMFACAALRCVLDERSLEGTPDAVTEGGMLLSDTVHPRTRRLRSRGSRVTKVG